MDWLYSVFEIHFAQISLHTSCCMIVQNFVACSSPKRGPMLELVRCQGRLMSVWDSNNCGRRQ